MDIAPEWEHGRELLLGIATGIRETGGGGGGDDTEEKKWWEVAGRKEYAIVLILKKKKKNQVSQKTLYSALSPPEQPTDDCSLNHHTLFHRMTRNRF